MFGSGRYNLMLIGVVAIVLFLLNVMIFFLYYFLIVLNCVKVGENYYFR